MTDHPAQQHRAEQERRRELHVHDLAAIRTWMSTERAAQEKDDAVRRWTFLVGVSTCILVWVLIAWAVREMVAR